MNYLSEMNRLDKAIEGQTLVCIESEIKLFDTLSANHSIRLEEIQQKVQQIAAGQREIEAFYQKLKAEKPLIEKICTFLENMSNNNIPEGQLLERSSTSISNASEICRTSTDTELAVLIDRVRKNIEASTPGLPSKDEDAKIVARAIYNLEKDYARTQDNSCTDKIETTRFGNASLFKNIKVYVFDQHKKKFVLLVEGTILLERSFGKTKMLYKVDGKLRGMWLSPKSEIKRVEDNGNVVLECYRNANLYNRGTVLELVFNKISDAVKMQKFLNI